MRIGLTSCSAAIWGPIYWFCSTYTHQLPHSIFDLKPHRAVGSLPSPISHQLAISYDSEVNMILNNTLFYRQSILEPCTWTPPGPDLTYIAKVNMTTNNDADGISRSPFLRLPLELREIIYDFLFRDQTIHIIRQFCSSRHGDLGATMCRLPSTEWDDCYALSKSSEKDQRGIFKLNAQGVLRNHTQKHMDCSQVPKGALVRSLVSASSMSILHVCRQTYRDASLVPYSLSTFWFNDEFALETFVMEALTARQREAITHIQFGLSVRAGKQFATCLRMLPNLKRVEIYVAYLNGNLFTPWLRQGATEPDDDLEFPLRLKAEVQVIAGFDKARQLENSRAERRKVAERLEAFLVGQPVDEEAKVSKGPTDRSMATWRHLLRNGCSI